MNQSFRLRPSFFLIAILLLAGSSGPASGAAAQSDRIDPALLAGMRARSIGPAAMSGRITTIDAVSADPRIIYIGGASGGVWKTTNGGMSWKPIFDDQPVHSIGAIAIFQPNPDVIWVGTGEGNPRNSASVGNGIYKSVDGGETWVHLGLEASERIHRVVLHPTDPNVAYIAALGQAWGENEERGVFKTTDGGLSWTKALYVDERTGATELTMDPVNSDHLIAGMWEFRRWPFFFKSGGPGSGMYTTWDGGRNWKQTTPDDGLPEGELGRMGVAFSFSDPEIVYALVEAERSAFLRSENRGRTWRIVNSQRGVASRPFYYGDIRVDPKHPNLIYNVSGSVTVSRDGGKSFAPLTPVGEVHGDHHAFWIHPENPDFILDGNDGGFYKSRDAGKTWSFVRNLPLAQYYHIAVDMDVPYNVYGGLQDNGSWRGPSAVREGSSRTPPRRSFYGGSIRNHHWQILSFGDGFDTAPTPDDSMVGYSMAQGGELVRWNLHMGEGKSIMPDGPADDELRFNWDAGLAVDPFDPGTVYLGSQFLHKSTDRGDNWTIVSPDMTTDNPEWQLQADSGGLTRDVSSAENYTTITAIGPSEVERGAIWLGTDDGRLHVTRDGGQSWESVEENLPGVPPYGWISQIKPSKFEAAAAFVVLDDHRRSDWTPYVLRTDDWGATWTNLVTDEIWGYALAIDQDPVDPNLLFLGTEFGLYVSLDGGGSWMNWTHGFPTASAMDLVVHPREHDLVVGTHGRSIYIIDDIGPLRGLTAEVLAESLHLFEVPDAWEYTALASPGGVYLGHGDFEGENRPYGALITYSLNVEGLQHSEEGSRAPQVTIEISDSSGSMLTTFKAPANRGINRATWNLRRDDFKQPPGNRGFLVGYGFGGPHVPPGNYRVVVSHEDKSAESSLTILPDPLSKATEADRRAKWQAILEMGELHDAAANAIIRILDAKSDIDAIAEKSRAAQERVAHADPQLAGVIGAARELKSKLTEIEARLWPRTDIQGRSASNYAFAKIGDAIGRLYSSWDAPSSADRSYMQLAEDRLDEAMQDVNQIFEEDVAEFRRVAREAGIELLSRPVSQSTSFR